MDMSDFKRIGNPAELHMQEGAFVCEIHKGVDLHMAFSGKTNSDVLFIRFNGSSDRERRAYPTLARRFMPKSLYPGHELILADPSLRTSDYISMAWYAGDSQIPTQSSLKRFIEAVANAIGVSKIVFLGSSAGGFAALYYSSCFKNSIAIVTNPQTIIAHYYSRHKDNYLKSCWPEKENLDDIGREVCLDLRKVYSQNLDNIVIYIQNYTDYNHLHRHMIPFLGSVSQKSRDKIICATNFFGSFGHKTPWSVVDPWLRAAIAAPSWSTTDLIDTWYRLSEQSKIDAITVSPRVNPINSTLSSADLHIAELLREYQLRTVKEE